MCVSVPLQHSSRDGCALVSLQHSSRDGYLLVSLQHSSRDGYLLVSLQHSSRDGYLLVSLQHSSRDGCALASHTNTRPVTTRGVESVQHRGVCLVPRVTERCTFRDGEPAECSTAWPRHCQLHLTLMKSSCSPVRGPFTPNLAASHQLMRAPKPCTVYLFTSNAHWTTNHV